MAATITMILRVISAQIGGLRNEMIARLESVDKDIQALTNRVFGSQSGR